jgi:hypothetical protein
VPGLPGRVFALASHGGDLVAGGLGLTADGEFPGLVARFDGVRWRAIGGGVFGDDVRAIATYMGDLVVAGELTQAGGQSVRSIARWDGAQWHPLGAGLDLSFALTGQEAPTSLSAQFLVLDLAQPGLLQFSNAVEIELFP